MYGLTVLVVDGEEQSRTRLLLCLRRLGLRALGVDLTADAVALLDALDADVALVHNDDGDEALAPLRQKTLVVKVARQAPVDEVVVQLLRELGRPEEAASLN
jgi:CheY-like chemotaxis protein